MLFGFSTGVLHQYLDAKQSIKIIKRLGCMAVELGFIRKQRVEDGWMEAITKEDLEGFKYISLHAPKMYYKDNEEARNIFKRIERINNLRPLDLVIFHPDNVVDVKVFKKVSFPVGFENMDKQKPFGRTLKDIEKLLMKNADFRFVLDTNHLKSNVPSMKVVDEFYSKLGHKIAEYHVSGLGSDYPHVPLFQTQETDILKAVKDLSKPIICESRLTPDNIRQEKEFIEKYLK
jgi:hypothetical protein